MLDISVIILTYNEELHIQRCIERIKSVVRDVYIVDSYSTDKTIEISKSLGAHIYQNKWDSNYARQFNWALDNLPITTSWVLRLDADEYLYPDLIDEIHEKFASLSVNVSGIVFKRRHIFLGKWVKRGTYPVKLLRLFKFGKGVCEQRWMDEHIQLSDGDIVEFDGDFADHNLNNISWWAQKHVGYAIREAIDLLDIELGLVENTIESTQLSQQAAMKRNKKHKYARQPLFWRSFAYFMYRYIFKFGFLEGKQGFLWNFMQAWWYRTLVDVKIWEIKQACGSDTTKIKAHLKQFYHIDI